MLSIYEIKPRFQSLLRPLATRLAAAGVTANAVTLVAMALSVALGLLLAIFQPGGAAYLALPIWLFLRMALNAIDGMLAREHGQKSTLGAYLNELTDVISDAALYLPFAFVAPFGALSVGLVIWLAAVSEMAGALGPMVGASRRYEGPMGKSDRAFVFGALGLWLGLAGQLPAWLAWLMPAIALLMVVNIINRVRAGLSEIRRQQQGGG
ncbi:MAG: CDP-alcohol phosphatidyltransferase family protein [Candidatus Accumulibacter meliphilus]|jgi:CDP-diacylglycerol--glycerol-3-phosphate 3-phosphatidyltransferase|uniref:CDP-alcohol phosphatidyltransferase family protein n=1 Tax=Candidatus Accumulibacter meliphilus TaxID=2211374 RepID=A0A369XH59_9PROT|nr:MAG: CDP-alcohol phosphatidyltransferase family protein [Candidatus Accumulibacter meliphilus]